MRSARMFLAAVALGAAPLASCGSRTANGLCSGRVAVGDYVLQFGQGLANFDDGAATELEADSLSVLDVILAARPSDKAGTDAEQLAREVAHFVAAMNENDWLVSVALEDPDAVAAADSLGSEDALRRANVVEAVVLTECGTVPTIVQPADTAETLPFPSVPAPTDTEPEATPPDDESEARAVGAEVGTAFGLTLTEDQVLCLGRNLNGVSDATPAQAGPGQYQAQFQTAFDECGINFEVPE